MPLSHWRFTAPLRLRSIFRSRQVEAELDEELQFHLEHLIEEKVAKGMSPREARRQALLALGGLDQQKERVRETRRVGWLTDAVADLGYAVRTLRRTPGLTAFVVVTLAVGIGMATTPFSMLDALIFRPYPVPRPGEVVNVVSTSRDDAFANLSYREYLDVREQVQSLDGVVASTSVRAFGFGADAGSTPRIKAGVLVSGNYFTALEVEPTVGRSFRAEEDAVPGRDPVAVLGHDLWRREMGADPGVVGRTVRLNGTDFTIVGVAPESFPGMQVFMRPDVYVPLAMAELFDEDPQRRFFEDRDDRELLVRGRLRDGVSIAEAQAEIAALGRRLERAHPASNRGRGAAVRTIVEMRTQADDVNWKFGIIFTVLALAVLAVACTNVAGLLISRARTRGREIAIRLTLGAGRSRLVRMLLVETLVLAGLGGLGGVVVGYGGIGMMRNFQIPSELPVTVPFRMDLRILLVCMAIALLSALLCGLLPALQSSRADVASAIKTAEVELPGRKRSWSRSALVVAQVAMSLTLLSGAFLMARSFRDSTSKIEGFARDHLLMVRFDPQLLQYDGVRSQRFYEQLMARVRELPGVRSAALATNPPLGLSGFAAQSFVPVGIEMPPDRRSFSALSDTVDEGYFATMEIAILGGRGFLPGDRAGTPAVAVVNEQLARHYWPGGDAVGKRLRLDGQAEEVEIVGIARTIPYRQTSERPLDFLYLPVAQRPRAQMVVLLRTTGDPLAAVDPVERVVRALDANMPLLETRTYDDLIRYHTVEGPGVAVRMIGTMGAVGLLLAVSGLYGLVAYNVSRRTREIGIRMAIGAAPRTVVRLVMGGGLSLVAIGTALGLVASFAVERLMNNLVFHSGRVDIVVYLVVVPAMVLATMLAAWVPARRAARLPPTLALRFD